MFIDKKYEETIDEIDRLLREFVVFGDKFADRKALHLEYLALRRKLRDQLACANR